MKFAKAPALLLATLAGARLLLWLADMAAALIALHAPDLYDRFGQPLDALYPLRNWVFILFVILWGVWLYRYHRDLANLFPGYPISPWGAVARSLIPIYHYWGVWNTWDTAQKQFEARGVQQPLLTVRQAVIIFYVNWFTVSTMKQIPAVKAWAGLNVVTELLDLATYVILFTVAMRALALTPLAPQSPEESEPSLS